MVLEDKSDLIEKAMKVVKSKPILINLLARRVRQLNKNARPLVLRDENEDNINVALREVIAGKIYPVFKNKEHNNKTHDEHNDAIEELYTP
ncbi:MAG: DNA-directed RNA polymerase subunit omega [Candidatus Auribacterota bacterium]|nr:DNA-directed RNA polymerase subunit omega [Candidatus Auribacterota bacterium]